MKLQIKAFYFYLGILTWIAILGLILGLGLNKTGLGFILGVLTLVLAPGFFLWRIFGFEEEESSSKVLLVIALGFSFYLAINLLALIVHLNIGQLSFGFYLFMVTLFSLAFWEDRKSVLEINLPEFKSIPKANWALIFLIVLGSILALLGVDAQSEKLVGDGAFHLAIIQKAMTAPGLSSASLSPTDTGMNLVYSFPLWNVFVAFIAKTFGVSIFTAFIQVVLPLLILMFLIVWGLLKRIFGNFYLSATGYLSLLVTSLASGAFYVLVPIRSPDSLVRWLLLPLVLALTIEYFYKVKNQIVARTIFLAILIVLMGLVHFTQLIGFVLILVIFVILSLIFDRSSGFYKKAGCLLSAIGILILPYLLIFEGGNIVKFFRENAMAFKGDTFRNKSYHDSGIMYLYTAFSLPIILLFSKVRKQLLFLAAVALALLIVSWQIFLLRGFFLKYFGQIFTLRALTDIPHYIFIGFLVFILLWLITNFTGKNKTSLYLSSIIGLILFVLLVWPFGKPVLRFIDEAVFSPHNPFFYTYFKAIFFSIAGLSFLAWLYFSKRQWPNLEVKSPGSFVLSLTLVGLLFSWPYFAGFAKQVRSNPNGGLVSNREISKIGDYQRIGGEKTINLLSKLPSNSIFLCSNVTVTQNILLYTPSFAYEYPYGISDFNLSGRYYDPNISPDERYRLIKSGKIDYVVSLRSSETDLFTGALDKYEQIFDNQFSYKVISKDANYQKEGEFSVWKVK